MRLFFDGGRYMEVSLLLEDMAGKMEQQKGWWGDVYESFDLLNTHSAWVLD